jgi:hypothetical protein
MAILIGANSTEKMASQVTLALARSAPPQARSRRGWSTSEMRPKHLGTASMATHNPEASHAPPTYNPACDAAGMSAAVQCVLT